MVGFPVLIRISSLESLIGLLENFVAMIVSAANAARIPCTSLFHGTVSTFIRNEVLYS